jgi:cellulose synthase (UDP-forming)
LLRTVAVVALVWGCAYLGWRLLETGRAANPEAFYVLWFVELYNFTSLVFLAFYGWRWSEPRRPPATPGYRVDVFVATYDESREVVEATLAGCAALRYPHETYLLDDGRRSEMELLAGEWGAHWISRPDNSHAKAGNINHALECTSGDLILCLDADHVPLPDALDATVGYFDDETVALVQSPHDFYNQDSVQHYEPGRHEQSMFFEVVCPGKDRHNGVYWCGSAAILRRTALVEVGGVATDTIAEDFHTTIKMHRAGWTTHYTTRSSSKVSRRLTWTDTCCSGTAGRAATSPCSACRSLRSGLFRASACARGSPTSAASSPTVLVCRDWP